MTGLKYTRKRWIHVKTGPLIAGQNVALIQHNFQQTQRPMTSLSAFVSKSFLCLGQIVKASNFSSFTIPNRPAQFRINSDLVIPVFSRPCLPPIPRLPRQDNKSYLLYMQVKGARLTLVHWHHIVILLNGKNSSFFSNQQRSLLRKTATKILVV